MIHDAHHFEALPTYPNYSETASIQSQKQLRENF